MFIEALAKGFFSDDSGPVYDKFDKMIKGGIHFIKHIWASGMQVHLQGGPRYLEVFEN